MNKKIFNANKQKLTETDTTMLSLSQTFAYSFEDCYRYDDNLTDYVGLDAEYASKLGGLNIGFITLIILSANF